MKHRRSGSALADMRRRTSDGRGAAITRPISDAAASDAAIHRVLRRLLRRLRSASIARPSPSRRPSMADRSFIRCTMREPWRTDGLMRSMAASRPMTLSIDIALWARNGLPRRLAERRPGKDVTFRRARRRTPPPAPCMRVVPTMPRGAVVLESPQPLDVSQAPREAEVAQLHVAGAST
jgi:hypothetical protein